MEKLVRLIALDGIEYPFYDFQCVCDCEYGNVFYAIQGCYYDAGEQQAFWRDIRYTLDVNKAACLLQYLKSLQAA